MTPTEALAVVSRSVPAHLDAGARDALSTYLERDPLRHATVTLLEPTRALVAPGRSPARAVSAQSGGA